MQETTTRTEPIKVAIVEDERDIREGLAMLINYTDGFECLGKYGSMEEAITSIRHRTPDVILSDIGLPGMSGIEGVKILKETYPSMTILMLSVYDDNERIFDALCAGAVGYLLKKTPPAKLIDSLKDAIHGGSPMSPEIARKVVAIFRDFRPPAQVDYDLSPHELRILKLLVEGHSYKTAATKLNVTTSTISFHLTNIYEKLQVHSKSEAVAKALQHRLIK
ncbi:MAG TPA: response regulator transcription factor [Pyrinomonadaceae bacterium]|jgi:DNA-binding NarL/FixJ family response regulator|nr:response regulator transcription factor [Pyrinomonadaceae bacterium]